MNSTGDQSETARDQIVVGPDWLKTLLIPMGLLLCGSAIVFVGFASLSLESLRDYGRFVRRPDDVTPERFARFQQFCLFIAASAGGIGAALIIWRRTVSAFVGGLIRPSETVPKPLPKAGDDPLRRFWLVLILVVGATERLSLLWNPMAYDESYSWVNFASRPLLQALGDLNTTNNHPFNTICMFVCGRLFGPQEWALRLGAMTFGLAVVPISFVWARRWMGTNTALVTTAMIAVSSPLVTYSADARGYVYVAAAALWLDDAFARIYSRSGRDERHWLQAAIAIIIGVWSMIIMGYAVVASSIWYLFAGAPAASSLSSDDSLQGREESSQSSGLIRLRQLVVLAWLTAIGSSVVYIPGYICRGTLFLDDPVMQKSTVASFGFLNETVKGLSEAFHLLQEGGIPAWVVGICAVIGLLCWPRERQSALRICIPFIVMLSMNYVRHVNPPPRIYLWLVPWFYLLASHGALKIAGALLPVGSQTSGTKFPRWTTSLLVLLILVLGLWHWATHRPVLFHASDRISYVSVPDVIRRLQREVSVAPNEHHRLIAPLPCDLPSIFYMDRSGFRVPYNGEPQTGEHIWLIARHNETPSDILEEGLVQLHGWQNRFTPWQRVDRYQTLDLYSAQVLPGHLR